MWLKNTITGELQDVYGAHAQNQMAGGVWAIASASDIVAGEAAPSTDESADVQPVDEAVVAQEAPAQDGGTAESVGV